MKTIYKFNLAIICALFLITSCEIDDGDDRDVEFTPKLGTATINLINAVTSADELEAQGFPINGVDLWVDETKHGQNMQLGDILTVDHEFPQGSMFRAVHGDQSPTYLTNGVVDYHTIFASNTAAAMLPAEHNVPLQGQLIDGASYTAIYFDFGGLSHDYPAVQLIEDDLTAPTGGNAKVRFVNAAGGECWNNSCVTTFMNGTTNLGTAIWGPFGAAITDFVEVSAGSLNIETLDGDGASYFTGSVNVTSGGVYTIVFSGNEGYSDSPTVTPEPNKYTVLQH
ncbi:MAG: hypothetical protein ABJH98_01890 [Reichenbachiella sp.]|uniref:hypothetical protein n=1 Tax=Reichenbachiella sp. TaxID=2184521 RepID=UPI0032996BBA